MGGNILLAAILLAVAAATPGFAQGNVVAPPEGSALPRDDGSLYSGAYEVTEEGDLIYGGDVEYRCEDLMRFGAPAKPGSEDVTADGSVVEPLTREAVELCARAGFPPDGATVSVPPGASATASASAVGNGGRTLPDTGGAPLAAGALLASRVRWGT